MADSFENFTDFTLDHLPENHPSLLEIQEGTNTDAPARLGSGLVLDVPPPTNRGGTGTSYANSSLKMDSKYLFSNGKPDQKLYEKSVVNSVKNNVFSINFDWFQGSIEFPELNHLKPNEIIYPLLVVIDDYVKTVVPEFTCLPVRVLNKGFKANNSYYDKPNISPDTIKTATRILACEFGQEFSQCFHLTTTGDYSKFMAPFYQSLPNFLASRIDVALDVFNPIQGSSFFFEVVQTFKNIASSKKMAGTAAGDWLNLSGGLSYYFGTTNSPVSIIVYQKGLQNPPTDGTRPNCPDWVRIEFKFRPKDQKNRLALATMTPSELLTLGICPDFLNAIGFDIAHTNNISAPRKQTAHEKSFCYLIDQYGKTLAQESLLLGDSDLLLKKLFSMMIVQRKIQLSDITDSKILRLLKTDDYLKNIIHDLFLAGQIDKSQFTDKKILKLFPK